MDKLLKFFQIANQIVWILVGLATLYSIYWFITTNPLQNLLNSFNPLSQMGQTQNPQQMEKLIQQFNR